MLEFGQNWGWMGEENGAEFYAKEGFKIISFDIFRDNSCAAKIVREGNIIYALLNGKVGVAKCCPEDTFNFDFGRRLAIARLFEDKQTEDLLLRNNFWDGVKIDTKVIVQEFGKKDRRAYFSCYIDGSIYLFPNGKSSFTTGATEPLEDISPEDVRLYEE